ncbi:MAG: hypothetical protein A2Y38_03945 [Spirochaetes bacterium GWB1_59_5]|nr:MAG: hypothetical protein A2Y38_03945 [Spirochaetes bacterium GWB1_59_5]
MESREQKLARLAGLKGSLLTVEGTPTEVYSRIVGYYRSVRNWNAGKREEFSKRREYSFPSGVSGSMAADTRNPATYLLFSRAACPNCPPVKEYLSSCDLPGVIVDVDTADGLALARRYEVLSTPTALILGADGGQLVRAHSRKQLETVVQPTLKAELARSVAAATA